MGNKQNCLSRLLPDPQQFLPEFAGRNLVETAEGFIDQKNVGIDRQCSSDRDALLHAAGKLQRILILLSAETHQLQIFCGQGDSGSPEELRTDGHLHVTERLDSGCHCAGFIRAFNASCQMTFEPLAFVGSNVLDCGPNQERRKFKRHCRNKLTRGLRWVR